MFTKRLALLLMCFVLVLSLCSCASNGLPITDSAPSVTLPPAEVDFVAPIGDASLEYTEAATLYLPSYDGISLTTVETQVSYSPVRPKAESLVRSLLAHAGTKEATAIGGSVRLSLYGISPVEVSRNVVTINLGASALQLDREALYAACQAIGNTLTQLDGIEYVNVLVMDKPVGLDIGNTLPMGAYRHSSVQDLGAAYEQLLSRRVSASSDASNAPFSAMVTLYFPLSAGDGMVSEVRSMSFENQLLPDLVTAILRELGSGPVSSQINSPDLPLLADLLTSKPVIKTYEETGGNILTLDFAHNLYDMLEAYGISPKQCLSSLCYTFSTFLPNVCGVVVTVNGEPVDAMLQGDDETEEKEPVPVLRSACADMLYDYCTLFFADEEGKTLCETQRPVPYYQATNPRYLLRELSYGPQNSDSVEGLQPVMDGHLITDTMLLGFALSDETLLVNFAPTFSIVAEKLAPEDERLMAYALVNTLCMEERVRNVCFFLSGSQFEGFSGDIYWAGLFYPLPLD